MSETLDLAFHATDAADARQQAEAWGLAEPNIASLVVVGVVRPFPDRFTWYQTTVAVTWRVAPQQEGLGLV